MKVLIQSIMIISIHSVYLVWLVNYSIQTDHIWVVELSHDGCLFEQFVPALLLLPVEGLDSHLKWSLRRACPLSLVDHPKLSFPQLSQEGDALRLQLKCTNMFLLHLGLDAFECGSWFPVRVFIQFIVGSTLNNCIFLQNTMFSIFG